MKEKQFLPCLILFSLLLPFTNSLLAQVKIGGTGNAAPSAVLELDGGTNRGLLLPRMTKQNMDLIANPAEGLVVYASNEQSLYLRSNGSWVKLNQPAEPFSLPYTGSFNHTSPVLALTNTNITGGAIQGISNAANSVALRGNTTLGTAVAGFSSSGVAGYFNAGLSSGTALMVTGAPITLGTAQKDGFLHIDGSIVAGNTVTINDADPLVQLNNAGTAVGYLQTVGNNIRIGTNAANNEGSFIVRNNGSERFFIDNIGNVGIGSTSVGAKLYVDASSSSATAMVINDQSPTIQLQNDGVNKGTIQVNGNDLRFGLNADNATGNIVFRMGGLDKVRFDTDADLRWGPDAGTRGSISTSSNNMVFSSGTAASRGYAFDIAAIAPPALEINGTTGNARFSQRLGISESGFTPAAKLHIDAVSDDISKTVIIRDEAPIIQFQDDFNDMGYITVDAQNDMVMGTNIANGLGEVAIRTNNANRFAVNNDGNVFISSNTSSNSRPVGGYRLAVKGTVVSTGFTTLAIGNWPDYVFDKSYKLKTLQETEAFILANHHLPNIPPAAEVEKNGLDLGDMQKRMMEKMEEMTLHLIEADKSIKVLQAENKAQAVELDALRKKGK